MCPECERLKENLGLIGTSSRRSERTWALWGQHARQCCMSEVRLAMARTVATGFRRAMRRRASLVLDTLELVRWCQDVISAHAADNLSAWCRGGPHFRKGSSDS